MTTNDDDDDADISSLSYVVERQILHVNTQNISSVQKQCAMQCNAMQYTTQTECDHKERREREGRKLPVFCRRQYVVGALCRCATININIYSITRTTSNQAPLNEHPTHAVQTHKKHPTTVKTKTRPYTYTTSRTTTCHFCFLENILPLCFQEKSFSFARPPRVVQQFFRSRPFSICLLLLTASKKKEGTSSSIIIDLIFLRQRNTHEMDIEKFEMCNNQPKYKKGVSVPAGRGRDKHWTLFLLLYYYMRTWTWTTRTNCYYRQKKYSFFGIFLLLYSQRETIILCLPLLINKLINQSQAI